MAKLRPRLSRFLLPCVFSLGVLVGFASELVDSRSAPQVTSR